MVLRSKLINRVEAGLWTGMLDRGYGMYNTLLQEAWHDVRLFAQREVSGGQTHLTS